MDAWLGVEIRHLAALAAIDAERSFRGAAERLGYVQSAVSQQIARLEALVGVRLVERTRGHSHVELTREGQLMLTHARRVLAQLQAAHADLEALNTGASDTLRVGIFESVATRIMPRVLARLARDRPGLRVIATEGQSEADLAGAVAEGALDAAFGELPLAAGPFEGRDLCPDPCVLVVNRRSPLATAERAPTLADIAGVPLVAHPAWRRTELLDRQMRAAGLEPDYAYRSDTNAAIQALVSAGLAAAIMPRLAVDEEDDEVAVLDLSEVVPARRLALYWHRDRSHHPELESFASAAQKACGQMNERFHASRRRALTSTAA